MHKITFNPKWVFSCGNWKHRVNSVWVKRRQHLITWSSFVCAQLVLHWVIPQHSPLLCQRYHSRSQEGSRHVMRKRLTKKKKTGGVRGERQTGFELIAADWDGEVITKLQTKTTHEWVSLSPGTHPYGAGQEVVRAEWGSNPISWNCCTSLHIQQAKSRHGNLQ